MPGGSPFSARETLRWQSCSRRPWEVGGVWPSSALPASIVSGIERRRRAPAAVPGGRDAPALGGGARRLRQALPGGLGAGGGGTGEGDAACPLPALLPPRELNMSLSGRVSCSMLNCFVSAAFLPPLLHASGATSQLLSPAPMLSWLP